MRRTRSSTWCAPDARGAPRDRPTNGQHCGARCNRQRRITFGHRWPGGIHEHGNKLRNHSAGVQQPLVVIQTDVAELPGGPSAQVFPNPAHDQLTVQVDQLEGGTSYYVLQDAAGRIVQQERITATQDPGRRTASCTRHLHPVHTYRRHTDRHLHRDQTVTHAQPSSFTFSRDPLPLLRSGSRTDELSGRGA